MSAANQHRVSAILLAAGQSRRMGRRNKLLLPLRGKTVLELVLGALLGVKGIGEVVVVTGADREAVEALLMGYPVRPAFNPGFEAGMGGSIREGIAAASATAAGYLICPGDLPLLTPAIIQALCREFSSAPEDAIIAPVFRGRRGHPVIFSRKYRESLLALQGDQGARPVILTNQKHLREVSLNTDVILRDVDTPEDYRKCRKDNILNS